MKNFNSIFYSLLIITSFVFLSPTLSNTLESVPIGNEAFPTHYDQYNKPVKGTPAPEFSFKGVNYDHIESYTRYMNSDYYSQRKLSEIIIPIGASESSYNNYIYQNLNSEEIEKFLETKQQYLNKLTQFILKISFNKLPPEKVNEIIEIFNNEFYLKSKELIGDRSIAINLSVFVSLGVDLEILLNKLRKIKPFKKIKPNLGFYYYLGAGATAYLNKKDNKTSKQLNPTIDYRYATETYTPFVNFDIGLSSSITIENHERTFINKSDLLMLPPIFEMVHHGDQLGISTRLAFPLAPGGSILLSLKGDAIRINVLKAFPKVIAQAKKLSNEKVKPKLKSVIRSCKDLFSN